MNEPELQLLIIDMGDCCVVKVEKGRAEFMEIYRGKVILATDDTILSRQPFDKLREAIEQKPVPRIEPDLARGFYTVVTSHQQHPTSGGSLTKQFHLTQEDYEALSQLAGKPLPIWSGGTWTRLPDKSGYMCDLLEGIGIKIWRYER